MRCFLILVGLALLCAWLAPSTELRHSAMRALESSMLMVTRTGGLPEEESDEGQPSALYRKECKATSARAPTKRKRVTPFISKKVAARQKFRCAMCGELLAEDWEVDHVVSLQHGGGNDLGNLQALHKRCHAYKNHLEQSTARIPRRP